MRTVCFLVLAAVSACGHDPKTSASTDRGAPVAAFTDTVVSVPVRAARAWTTALAPNSRGGWNFITQTYELNSGQPTEFVVLDLHSGKQTRIEGEAELIANSNYQVDEQLRAPNGRIFFAQVGNRLAYYDPQSEQIKQLPPVIPPGSKDTILYRLAFGPDGMLYSGSHSYGLPTIVKTDPNTLKSAVLGRVGKDRNTYSYAYYLAADPPWVYVAVGQDPWELVALNIETGSSTILATRPGTGFMQLDTRPQGITATLISGLRTPQQQTERVWCADGKLYPFKANFTPSELGFKPRNVMPRGNPIKGAPELDLSKAAPDAAGVGRIRWRLRGEPSWRESSYKIQHTAAVDIESLLALPDGGLLGNAKQYHAFFRYNPGDGSTRRFTALEVSGGPRVISQGTVYITGYPNGLLYAYDPSKPWSVTTDSVTQPNPRVLGSFSQAGAHYPYFLLASRTGRLYYAGRRERDGIGTGVGFYDPATKRFGGHHRNLSFFDPQGFVVLDARDQIIFSGRLHDDPTLPGKRPEQAELIVFDRELNEIERQVVKPGLLNTGLLFNTPAPSVIVGVIAAEQVIYRYDTATRRLLEWKKLPGAVGPLTQRADGTLWVMSAAVLLKIDPSTLAITEMAKLEHAFEASDLLVWQGASLFWATGTELHQLQIPEVRPTR